MAEDAGARHARERDRRLGAPLRLAVPLLGQPGVVRLLRPLHVNTLRDPRVPGIDEDSLSVVDLRLATLLVGQLHGFRVVGRPSRSQSRVWPRREVRAVVAHTRVGGGVEGEVVATLAEDLLLVAVLAGDEPGVLRAGSLGVDAVARLGLVPEDVALGVVAHALCGGLLLVVAEEEGVLARTLGVPLVAGVRLWPVILIVARRAAALAAVALAGVLLEDDELAQRARAAGADLVALDRVLRFFVREVEVGTGAGILDAYPDLALASGWDEELARPARPRGERLVALTVLRPEDVVVLAGAFAFAGHLVELENLKHYLD